MYSDNGKIIIEEDDQCNECQNYLEGVAYPLLTALGLGGVYLEDSLNVENCGFYRKFKRRLRIVRINENNNAD